MVVNMKNSNNFFTVFTIISIIGIFVMVSWMVFVTPALKNDFTAFEDIGEYSGIDAYVENIGEKLPDPVASKDILEYKVVEIKGNILEIISTYSTFDLVTGEQVYENTNTYFVDRTTRKHVETEEWYFIFPYNVQKHDYLIIHPNMEVPATFVFEGTKHINDLEVYVFSCETFADDFSDAWSEFAPVNVYADQTCETSIEPITGKTIQFSITWDMYVIQNGLRSSIELGGSHTTDFTENILLQSAKDTKQLFYIYDFIIPIFITLIFIGIFFACLYNSKSKQKEKIIIKQHEELHQANKFKIEFLEQKAKREKMSIIGELSARLSHDLRNPLSIIQASLNNIELKYGQMQDTETSFSRIYRAIERIVHQTEDVLEFIQSRHLEKEMVSLNEIISEVISSLQIPKGITIKRPKQDMSIYCDYVKICILLKNLIHNSIQACNDEGIIEIKTNTNLDTISIFIFDSGPGIPTENMAKIFEPLFTTKQRGTGLGLASCKTIIESHGGSISVNNNPTSFKIMLPQHKNGLTRS